MSYLDEVQREVRTAVISADDGRVLTRLTIPAVGGRSTADRSWSRDGRSIHYVESRNGAANIWSQPIDGGPPHMLTNFASDDIFAYAWSRDGRLAVTRGRLTEDVVLMSSVK